MPFTPFHVGPALLAGLLLYRWTSLPVLVLGSVIVDAWAVLVFFGLIDGPYHAFLHTGVSAVMLGVLLAVPLWRYQSMLNQWLQYIRLDQRRTFGQIAVSGILGTVLGHLLLDAVLYTDVYVFFPSTITPFHGLVSSGSVYLFCAVAFIAAVPLGIWIGYRRWS